MAALVSLDPSGKLDVDRTLGSVSNGLRGGKDIKAAVGQNLVSSGRLVVMLWVPVV